MTPREAELLAENEALREELRLPEHRPALEKWMS